MRAISSSSSPDPRQAVDDHLAAIFGWFEAAALPETLESVIDQLEAAYQERRELPEA
jgi:hypothetical protein